MSRLHALLLRVYLGCAVSLGCAASFGCTSGLSSSNHPAEPQTLVPELSTVPLLELLPSAGFQWALQLSPRALWSQTELRELVLSWIEEERWEALQLSLGLDVRQIDEAWLVRYSWGTLYLVSAPPSLAQEARARFIAHSQSSLQRKAPPKYHHLTALLTGEPAAYAEHEGRWFAVALQDPSLVRFALASSQKKLTRSRSAFADPFLKPLLSSLDAAPLHIYLRGPFSEDSALLLGALGVRFSIQTLSGQLQVDAQTLGLWPAPPQEIEQHMQDFLRDRLEDPALRALGSQSQSEPLHVRCQDVSHSDPKWADVHRCQTSLAFSLREVIERLHWLGSKNLAEFVRRPHASLPDAPVE